jgi:hypothetical protein
MSETVTNVVHGSKTWGLLAEFPKPTALLAAARRVRDAGYKRFDVFTPYLVHGMDQAMGLGRSKLGWIVVAGALAGIATAVGLQVFCNVIDCPLITQGKPYFSWQAYLIVTFELAVLFGSFAAVLGMFALNGLPQWYHPTLKSEAFAKATDNGFFLAIEVADEKFALEATRKLLEEAGAISVVALEE